MLPTNPNIQAIILNATLPLSNEQMALFDKLENQNHKSLLLEAINNYPAGSLLNLFQMEGTAYASAIITSNGVPTLIFG